MKNLIVVFLFLTGFCGSAQMRFSFATDLSLMRNFSPMQKFWAVGQTIQFNFHFSPKQSAYTWVSYYTNGKFENDFIASAKSSATLPSTIPFTALANLRNKEVSVGWKHFFKGRFDAETGYNIYSIAGFGLLFSKVENLSSVPIDTSLYTTPTQVGSGKFYRLTIDLGAGVEFPASSSVILYGDVRTWIPTTDYPSPYLHSNKNVPLPFMINGGVRILFGY